MDTVSFFKKVTPAAGLKLLAELQTYTDKQTGKQKQGWMIKTFQSVEAMAEAVAKCESLGKTVYYACHGFGDWYTDQTTNKKRIRTATNVVACRSLYDDIDCSSEKSAKGEGYTSKKEAWEAVKSFLRETGIPAPMVVDSGGGLHLYWPLTEDITPDEWRHLAELKRRLTMHFKLRVDHAVDMDLARVLRPVGSFNKKRDPWREVKVVRDCQAYTPVELRRALEQAIEKTGAPELHHKSMARNMFAHLERDYPDSYADVVAAHCATLRLFKETGIPDSEPLWHKCIGAIKYCVDGPEKIHEWSAKYDGYREEETQAKIDQWRVGAASCETIRECNGNACEGCTNTVMYPIQLGYTLQNDGFDPQTVNEIDNDSDTETLAKDELIKRIWGSNVRVDGTGMSFALEDKDTGQVVWKRFAESIFYPVDLVKNEEGEWEVVIEYFTQYKKKRRFSMPTSYVAAADKLAGTLAAHTIFLTGKNGRAFAMEHLKQMILGLQHHRQEVVTEEAFGWNAEGNGFIIGSTMICEDGKERQVLLSEHIRNSGLAKDFGVSGTRDEWVRLVNEIYNRPGAEPYQFAFLVSAASPLISMAGIEQFHGIPVAYTGAGGRGKTTACRLACSIWGKGDNFLRSSNKDGATINGLLAMTAIYRHLPLIMDEMTGQSVEGISEMLYALSNGQSKIRLNSQGAFANKLLKWDLFTFITGNLDITGLLANLDRQRSEAVQVRCFEVKIPDDFNERVFAGVDVKRLIDVELAKNYGVVGRELIRIYMKHRAKIVDKIHKLRQEYQPRTADESRERFYIDLICFALAAGAVMKARDLIRFDLDAVRKWAFENVKALRLHRAERRYTDTDIIGDYISSLHEHTIVTKHILDMRKATVPEVPIETVRGEPLARKAVVDHKFFVSARSMQIWGKANNVAPNAVREALDRHGYIVRVVGRGDELGAFNFRLGQGTTLTTGLARCYELDYDKVHGITKEESANNVIPISPVASGETDEQVA